MNTFIRQFPKLAGLTLVLLILRYTPGAASAALDSSNLLQNSSFELNDQPTLQFWVADTTLREFVQDVPPNGGQWSLQLSPGWIPQEGYARTYVSGQTGVGVYQLSVWIKSLNGWRGTVRFGQWVQGGWINSKEMTADSARWIQYSLIDTLSMQPNDTIAVHLSAGETELASGAVLFDLVRLEKMQSITTVQAEHKPLPNHFVLDQNYPNPFNPTTAVRYQLSDNSFVTLTVFDLTGREITTLTNGLQTAGSYTVTFDGSTLPSGVYFYSLRTETYRATKKMLLIK